MSILNSALKSGSDKYFIQLFFRTNFVFQSCHLKHALKIFFILSFCKFCYLHLLHKTTNCTCFVCKWSLVYGMKPLDSHRQYLSPGWTCGFISGSSVNGTYIQLVYFCTIQSVINCKNIEVMLTGGSNDSYSVIHWLY